MERHQHLAPQQQQQVAMGKEVMEVVGFLRPHTSQQNWRQGG
jgi:hypothetical protein